MDEIYLQKKWKAKWISVPDINPSGYGVYLFRKNFDLENIPETFPVYVSGDNRYMLFVNQKLVSMGPARGDVSHWNYKQVDLAPFLQSGKNIVAAKVWNEGEFRPEANMTFQTGFILQGGIREARALNTDKSWQCIQDTSYTPIEINLPSTSYRAGPGELVDMNKQIHAWSELDFEDSSWVNANEITKGYPKDMIGYGSAYGWLLIPSKLPQMEMKLQRIPKLVKAEGVKVLGSFPAKPSSITIPAKTTATLLLDQTFLTNAYPTLIFSEGKHAEIILEYAEALFESLPFEKGNRDEVEGKIMKGRYDCIISNGTKDQQFTSLSWRTFRYLQIKVTTGTSPLVINDIYGNFTGYPFELKAKLETDRPDLQKIMEIGWRTARLCATETYMDCPYYEQLQYVGDTRIQGLISLYNTGDDRLLRNAINILDYSRVPEGLTLARYPANNPMIISPFSIWYIAMLHDYMMYGNDENFIKDKLAGVRQVMAYYEKYQQPDGSLKNLPGWIFTDWVKVPDWFMGCRSYGEDGNSALIDLQLVYAYQCAADLEEEVGMAAFSELYREKAELLKHTIRSKYWDSSKKLFADRSEKDLFSQHTNSLAIITGTASKEESRLIAEQLLADSTLAPASIYFKFYLHQALTKAGLGDGYLNWLDTWRENMDMGLTTWGETSEVNETRSDCHAWGASPNIEFFRTVLGIDSDAPGFTKVKIEPHLGKLTEIGGEMPHPYGIIKVNYSLLKNSLKADIVLPSNTSGRFIWKGKEILLNEGENHLKL
ncbi:alpha-L-rhamnosidase C-terminal domain-containing protein [Labilibaculum manganireducens]|uniref:alpha-L-rhamnosidase-related protein n=1 Tax=Labilibaculum manganireducens TaxID=1940525 RepID=UPI001C55C227|nr:alpha-L-rhamnosidase C-terminal domain-containing protein [Labilibaculum manganireducens]